MRIESPTRDLRRAGCVERRTSGSGSGPRKPAGGNTGKAPRSDFHHNFLTLPGSVADMLAEARGYRLKMVLAHQDLAQLPKEVAAAASANARTKLLFTIDPKDAKELAAHTLPELDDRDLAHLDRYIAAARLVVNGRELPAFTLVTDPPPPIVGEATAIRQACLQRLPQPSPTPLETLAKTMAAKSRQRRADRDRRRNT